MNSHVFINIGTLLTLSGGLLDLAEDMLGVLNSAVMVIENGKVAWLGKADSMPSKYSALPKVDCEGKLIMPGLVDSHTHSVFGGSREIEYEKRCSGISYADIAAKGGGIKYTVEQTRNASLDELYEQALARVKRMMQLGVTTLEIKSGYGLDLETEIKQLEVVKKLKQNLPINIVATYLGAHEIPKDKSKEEYIKFLVDKAIPEIAKRNLAEFCDIFCETGVFNVEESRRILSCAKEHGFKLKLHAEELTSIGGAELAAELGATSADHLVYISDIGIEEMVKAKVVFGLLPGTTFFLGKKQYVPARKIIQAGGQIALATDCNPGSCTCENLPLITTIACSQLGLSPAEALWAITKGGAMSLGRAGQAGEIRIGNRADFIVLNAKNYQEIPYAYGRSLVTSVYVEGVVAG